MVHLVISELENKDVNIDNELGSQTINETSQLKKLTASSRNRIRIQRKNQKAYDTILHAKGKSSCPNCIS